MKKLLAVVAIALSIASCSKKSELEKAIEKIDVPVTIERFDQEFYQSKDSDLSAIKAKYPHLFPANIPDSVWIAQKNDTLFAELYTEIQKKYKTNDFLEKEFRALFQHIKHYFPNQPIPKVNTVIAEVDYLSKSFFTDSIAIVSLDLYLGKDHYFYEMDDYIKANFEPEQIIPDMVHAFGVNKIPFPSKGDFLSRMIYEGKILYLKDLLIPSYPDTQKIGYTPEQLEWAVENEENVWRYFIEENLLYNTNPQLLARFINMAPFSKFYLDIDNETPGRIATWIGWQIVRAYAKNNPGSVQDLLYKDAEEIFKQSKYKPNR